MTSTEEVPSKNSIDRDARKHLPISLGKCCDKIDGVTMWSFSSNEELESFTTGVIRKQINIAEFGTTSTRQLENQLISHQGIDQTKSCKTCKKIFLLRSSLDVHRCIYGKTIATELLHCEFCSHASYRSDTMRMHVRLIHGTRLERTLLSELFDDFI